MKFKIFSILIVVVLSFGLIFFNSCEKKAAKLNLKEDFVNKINQRNGELEKLFSRGHAAHREGREEDKEKISDDIADLFLEDTILIVPDAKKTNKRKDIAKFWKKVIDKGVTRVTFEIEEVYVSGQGIIFPNGVPLPEGGELAYIIGTCTFETEKEEDVIENATLDWFEMIRHQKICDCESLIFGLSSTE
jgi:hypothetical protein